MLADGQAEPEKSSILSIFNEEESLSAGERAEADMERHKQFDHIIRLFRYDIEYMMSRKAYLAIFFGARRLPRN
jgi:hypothetical protein